MPQNTWVTLGLVNYNFTMRNTITEDKHGSGAGLLKPQIYEAAKKLDDKNTFTSHHRSRKDQTESFHPDSEVEDCRSAASAIWADPRKTVPSMSQLSQTRRRIRELKILRTNRDRWSCSNNPTGTYSETNLGTDRETDMPQVAATDQQEFHLLETRNVEERASRELNRGEDAHKSSRRRCRERRLIQTTINLAKINQTCLIKILQIQYSADHQSFENRAASLEHAKTSRRLCISRQDQAANCWTSCEHASKVIKNTAQRKNPITQEEINQVRCKAKFPAFKPCRNLQRATRMGHLPCRYVTTDANDAKGTEYQSMRGRCWKNKEEHPDTFVYLNRPSPQQSPSAERREKTHDERSRAAPEETVPEEKESMKTHVWFEACPLTTRDGARSKSKRRQLQERRHSEEASPKRKTVQQNSRAWWRWRQSRQKRQKRHAVVADRSAHDTAKQETITELEAAMKTFVMRVDTAREQRDRHFSRAREGEVTCERETNLHKQQTTLL